MFVFGEKNKYISMLKAPVCSYHCADHAMEKLSVLKPMQPFFHLKAFERKYALQFYVHIYSRLHRHTLSLLLAESPPCCESQG